MHGLGSVVFEGNVLSSHGYFAVSGVDCLFYWQYLLVGRTAFFKILLLFAGGFGVCIQALLL